MTIIPHSPPVFPGVYKAEESQFYIYPNNEFLKWLKQVETLNGITGFDDLPGVTYVDYTDGFPGKTIDYMKLRDRLANNQLAMIRWQTDDTNLATLLRLAMVDEYEDQ